ncbi:MAG TPA: succinate dehydrogenase, cytochrome b556 subunit [Stellaceae bacterium]|nr:succinate dehydrogenase, cytochrome b556 subunit [Stellaceae bacterium]
MTPVERPLSPHLQIYKPQLTSVLSITHRATGLALSFGTVFLVWFLAAAAWSDGAFALAQGFWSSWLGEICLFGWSVSLFYHLLNGIRHLAWDIGLGFELKTVYRTGWAVVIGSLLLTLAAWIVGLHLRGQL